MKLHRAASLQQRRRSQSRLVGIMGCCQNTKQCLGIDMWKGITSPSERTRFQMRIISPILSPGPEMSSGLFGLIALTRSQHIQSSNLLPSAYAAPASALRWVVTRPYLMSPTDGNVARGRPVSSFCSWLEMLNEAPGPQRVLILILSVSSFGRFVQLRRQLDDCAQH